MDKRYASRRRWKQRNVCEALNRLERAVTPTRVVQRSYNEYIQRDCDWTIQWDELPDGIDVAAGELHDKPSRVQKKRQQLQSMINIINQEIQAIEQKNVEQKQITIIEFGCGSGHLGILLAHVYPQYKIILNECKEYSIQNCKNRIAASMLTNVEVYNCDVRSLPPFQLLNKDNNNLFIGVGLHTCGLLCDIILKLMKEHEYSFIIVPCCYGQLGRLPPAYSKADYEEYCILHVCTDIHVSKRCMNAIDCCRLHFMNYSDFTCFLTELDPLDCSPKNQVLIGQWQGGR